MRLRTPTPVTVTVALAALLSAALAGCGRDTSSLPPAPPNTDPIVFDDNFGSYATFQAFLGSKVDAVTIDTAEKYQGTASLKITVPAPGDPAGTYAGGAFTTDLARQLTGYDALTFWAKASKPAVLDVAGLGNDNTGTSKYEARWKNIGLTTTWTQYVIPIPLPAKLTAENGLFFFAEAPENGQGYTIWFDEVLFGNVGTITNPRPAMATETVQSFVGAALSVEGTQVTFDVGGTDEAIEHMPAYFTFASSNDSVATATDGVIHVVGAGSATITGKLGTVSATGAVTVIAAAPPATPPPVPAVPAANVISLFSNAYTNVSVDTWSADWDQADVAEAQIAGNDLKVYTSLVYAGIEFTSHTIDASAMTHFHLDVWAPSGTLFKVKLVDFGANGVYDGGGDDREHELAFNAGSVPAFTAGTWVSLEIPFTQFVNLTTRAHLAQLIISGDTGTAYVDNIYLHK
jgi:hypothetical protein